MSAARLISLTNMSVYKSMEEVQENFSNLLEKSYHVNQCICVGANGRRYTVCFYTLHVRKQHQIKCSPSHSPDSIRHSRDVPCNWGIPSMQWEKLYQAHPFECRVPRGQHWPDLLRQAACISGTGILQRTRESTKLHFYLFEVVYTALHCIELCTLCIVLLT